MREDVTLTPLTAWEQLQVERETGSLWGRILPLCADEQAAYAVAENAVVVFYATRGQWVGVHTPRQLLDRLDLQTLAHLRSRYQEQETGDWEEAGVNESFEE